MGKPQASSFVITAGFGCAIHESLLVNMYSGTLEADDRAARSGTNLYDELRQEKLVRLSDFVISSLEFFLHVIYS